MSDSKETQTPTERLARILLTPKNAQEMEAFLEDFLSPAELETLQERWALVDLLLQGFSQRQVRDRLGISISKVSRGATILKYGRGGFKKIWSRIPQKTKN